MKLLPCPFCGATPHRGLTKVKPCALHGEPLQNYSIWCPRGHARVVAPLDYVAVADWNTRAPTHQESSAPAQK